VAIGNCFQHHVQIFQSWCQRHLDALLMFQMLSLRAHRFFWRVWSAPLAALAFIHPNAPHARAALVVAAVIELIAFFCEVREKKAMAEWASLP
jgi:hypothetical protein